MNSIEELFKEVLEENRLEEARQKVSTTKRKVSDLRKFQSSECPVPLDILTGDLRNADTVEWSRQADGQLTRITISFKPSTQKSRRQAEEEKRRAEEKARHELELHKAEDTNR